MSRGWDRAVVLSGVVFVVLTVVGGSLEGNEPDDKASGTSVLAWYGDHHGTVKAGAVLLTFGFIAFVVFASVLRAAVQQAGSDDLRWLASLVLAGGILTAGGQTIAAGFTWALASAPGLSADAAQALNTAANDVVLTSAAGWFIFSVAAGIAVLRTRLASRWLGWTSIVIGVIAVTPAEFVAFIGLALWSIIVSISLFRGANPDRTPVALSGA